MTTVTGSGFPASLWGWFHGYFTVLSSDSTGFTAQLLSGGSIITVTGVGLTYTATPLVNGPPGATVVAITGGTITGVDMDSGSAGHQTYSNPSVSGADATAALNNQATFNNLFFGGNDTFTWSDTPGDTIYGYDGNDTFNISHWGLPSFDPYDPVVDGGAGTNTLNITGGVSGSVNASGTNFSVSGIQQINLGAGYDYNLIASIGGSTVTIDGSALGASNTFSFVSYRGAVFSGTLTLIGGAGDDNFQAGTGTNTIIGGGGSDTVSFSSGAYSPQSGVTANLSIAGFQSLGTSRGVGWFTGIENLIGTSWDDTLTGDASNNVFYAGNDSLSYSDGNDVLNGGAGFDTAVMRGARGDYTITSAGGTTMLTGLWGTATLTGIEQIRFSDQTLALSNGGVTVSHAPLITTGNVSATLGQVFSLSSLFNISNPSQEAITNYQLWDSTADPNSGFFRVAGVAQAAGTIITITAAQLAQTSFNSGRVSDNLQIRSLNAAGWSAGDNASWAPFTVSVPADHSPVLTTHNVSVVTGQTIQLSSLISVSDADSDPITSYQLWDSNSDPNSGHWMVNGLAKPAGSIITVSASDSVYFAVGTVADNLQVRASDGIMWSALDNAPWAPFTVTPLPNHAPVLTPTNTGLRPGQSLNVSAFFQASDPDGDSITKYQFWIDTTDPNGGYLSVIGIRQPAKTVTEVTADWVQYNPINFVGGTVPTQVQVRAFDGKDWSAPENGAWTTFTIPIAANHPPQLTDFPNVYLIAGQTISVGSLFSVYDGDSDPITKYQLWVDTRDPNAGYITINGVRMAAATVIEVTAAQLPQVSFVSGTVATQLQVRAFDGTDWSAADNAAWSPFTVSPTPNQVPVVTVSNLSLARGTVEGAIGFFSASDADGDTITKYQLVDTNSDPNSGYLTVNGVQKAAGTIVEITTAQLAQTNFVVGRIPDTINIRAYDGKAWSNGWTPATIAPPTNHAPSLTTSNTMLAPGASVALSTLFNVSDADSDTVTKYQLWDATRDANGGRFALADSPLPAGQIIEITAGQLTQTTFVMGSVATNLQIRAFDGVSWSAGENDSWAPFTVSPKANRAPVVTTTNKSLAAGSNVALTSLFNVIDADGDAITQYQLWDATRDATSGYFTINGVQQAAGTIINVSAAQLAQTKFVVGQVPDGLQIRAFDGAVWSAGENDSWAPFTVTPIAPAVTGINQTGTLGQALALSSLFSATTPNGAITKYQLLDSTTDPTSGYITINGAQQAVGTVIEITAAQLAQTAFVVGHVNDSLQIRAFDGTAWSAAANATWASATITAPVNRPPSVTTFNTGLVPGVSVALSTLFNVSDPDGDTITKYQLWDATRDASGGRFALAGSPLPTGQIIEITAAQLAQTTFVMGSVATNLQIRAFDGKAWSAGENDPWAPFIVSVRVNHAPGVTTSNKSLASGSAVALSTLFSVGDADGDAITKYQLWDATRDPNSGYFTINGVQQAAGTIIDVSAAQLAQTNFVVGQVSDMLQIRAFDGAAWSAGDNASWAPFTVAPVLPIVMVTNQSGVQGQSMGVSNLFSATSANGPITKYQLLDTTTDPSSGHITVNGVTQAAGTVVEITAAQLSQTAFVIGHINDNLQIRAFDGTAWSAPANATWASVTVSPPPNHLPTVTTPNRTSTVGASLALSTLFTVSDTDGDTITKYQLWDANRDPDSGYFTIGGVKKVAGTIIDVSAAQLAQTNFIVGVAADGLQIRAFDGRDWSAAENAAWSSFVVSPNIPVVAINLSSVPAVPDPTLQPIPDPWAGHAGQALALPTLIIATSPNGPITKYQLWDGTSDPGSGYFTVNGVVQSARTVIEITAAQLAQTSFVIGQGQDVVQIRAFDGQYWSAGDNAMWGWSDNGVLKPFLAHVAPNNPPSVLTSNRTMQHGATLALANLTAVSDPDNDTITKYQLWDATRDPNSGYFVVNGVAQAAGTVIEITAAQAAQTSFVAGTVGDNLQIRAFDGLDWSAAENMAWSPFSITVPANVAPVVTTGDRVAVVNQTLALSNLISVSDGNNDSITRYQLWDATRDPNSGHFVVAGAVQPAGTIIDITAAQLPQTSFATGTVGDTLQIRAFDGYAWSAADNAAWMPFTISVRNNTAPVVTTVDKNMTAGQSLSLSSLFSVNDADGDTMTKYELWDATRDANSGHFVINGAAEAAGTVIGVTAAQLTQTSFLAGTMGDALQIRAFDGYAWSAGDNAAWAPFHINV